MSDKHKILFDWIVIVLIFLFIILFRCFIPVIYSCKNKRINKCIDSRSVTYLHAIILAIFLSVSNVFTVLFKLISCQEINEYTQTKSNEFISDNSDTKMVHFYFGSQTCHSFDIFAILLLFSVLCMVTFVVLMKIDKTQNANNYNIYFAFYKDNMYSWEGIVLIRRGLFLFTSIMFYNDYVKLYSSLISINIFIYLQYMYKPYKYNVLNNYEFCLLVCLCILILIIDDYNISHSVYSYYIISISILILFPIMVLIYYITLLYSKNNKIIETSHQNDGSRALFINNYAIN